MRAVSRFGTLKKMLALTALTASCLVVPAWSSTSSYYLDVSRLELIAQPATNVASGAVKVNSNSDQSIRLKVIPRLWHLSPDGSIVYDTAPTTGFNLLDNVSVNPDEFQLLPNKGRLVRFIVKTPETPADAEYPLQLYFEPTTLLETTAGNGKGVNNMLDVVPVFTTTVYVLKGHPMPKVAVQSFTCDYQAKPSELNVKLNLNNEGARHARLFGNLLITAVGATDNAAPLDVLHLKNSTLIIAFPNTPRVVENALTSDVLKKLSPGTYEGALQLVDERSLQPAIKSTCQFTIPKS